MRITLLLFFLLPALSGLCQQQKDWQYPDGSIYRRYTGDTTFYIEQIENGHTICYEDQGSNNTGDSIIPGRTICKIQKGDSLQEFYTSGNLQSVCGVKEIAPDVFFGMDKKEHTVRQFEREGWCKIYFNDTTRTIAATGYYYRNKTMDDRQFYDKRKRLIQKSYPMPLWTRSDYYDTTGHLAKQIDRIETFNGDVYTVREAEFVNGKEKVISNKTFFTKIYLRYLLGFMIAIFCSFFLRIPFNHIIYNREEGTSIPLFWFPGMGVKYGDAMFHGIKVMFTFWWINYKPENRKPVLVANTLSVTALVLFFGTLIALGFSGELH